MLMDLEVPGKSTYISRGIIKYDGRSRLNHRFQASLGTAEEVVRLVDQYFGQRKQNVQAKL